MKKVVVEDAKSQNDMATKEVKKEYEAKMPKGQNVMSKRTKICGQRNMPKMDSKID